MLACAIPMAMQATPVKRHTEGKDEFIVLLAHRPATAAVDGLVQSLSATYSLRVKTVWKYGLRGFLCAGSAENLDRLAEDARVDVVEQNIQGHAIFPVSGTQYSTYNGQYLWFLDRLDAPTWADRNNTYNMCPEARNVYAYVLDTGAWNLHPEFEYPYTGVSRVVKGLNFAYDRPTTYPVTEYVQNDGGCGDTSQGFHATAVAASLAGTHIGSSKAQIVSLQVISCSTGDANFADYFDALNWIDSPDNPYRFQAGTSVRNPALVNQSNFVPAWTSYYSSYQLAVKQFVLNTDIPFFKSADNFNADACQFSPNQGAYTNVTRANTGVPLSDRGTVFVVGGMYNQDNDNTNYRWWQGAGGVSYGFGAGSNSGACVSIYAPAVSIYVAQNTSSQPYTFYNGTSFAAPLVAGMAARYLSTNTPSGAAPPHYYDVYNFFLNQATQPITGPNTTEQWACGYGATLAQFYNYDPGTCPQGYTKVHYDAVGNSSNAKVAFWNTGTCP